MTRALPGNWQATLCCLGLLAISLCTLAVSADAEKPVRIGSKTFIESYVIAEVAAQLLESRGVPVERRVGLGGTLIAYEALRQGSVDVYPEYTGTLTETVLHTPGADLPELHAALADQGLALAVMLGFNNSYAIALDAQRAAALNILSIGDLAAHPQLRLSFSHEFLSRGDGWPALQAHYNLPQRPGGIEHALAYGAVASGAIDGTDAYTTDGELDSHALTLLRDDQGFFPDYSAALLIRADLPAHAREILAELDGRIDAGSMRRMNRRVADGGEAPAMVAADFLLSTGLTESKSGRVVLPGVAERVLGYTLVHLKLTAVALLLACLVAVPLALALAPKPSVARGFLYATGLLQTIPALALLALLIPVVGLGQGPAIIALFLYSLLPIVRNTLTGLFVVDPLLKQVAAGMGLTRRQQLLRIELPLAAPTILAGIKTAAVISIGTATLAAFVGAGGMGEPIITGLT
ncbi:MAG: ABC transporter permease subunit, partial [Halioglobus sp.]|nr:ABC transporter permease subunit [Halioglobus sp.]